MTNVIKRTKYFIEHHYCLQRVVPIMRKLGIIHILHVLCEKTDRRKAIEEGRRFQEFYEKHEKEFEKLFGLLEDDFSRYTLAKVLEYRKTHKISVLKNVIVGSQYFQRNIFEPVKDEVFIDGGAYTGDTIQGYIKSWGGYRKIYAWEPDEDNLKQLKQNICKYKNIEVIPFGMWKEKDELGFEQGESATAKICANAAWKVKVDSVDNLCAGEKVTFIKMDIEGSEKDALKGAISVIKRDKPRLAICIYHHPEDLYEIPFWIKSVVPEYKLYIRHHSDTASETVVYATL